MTIVLGVAAAAIFLLGVGAGIAFMLTFSTLIVNTLLKAVVVSLIALAPMCLGAVVVGSIASRTGMEGNLVDLAFFGGVAAGAIRENLKQPRRQR
jgi:hypothetical protein